ncbi:hypothetical protein Tsubulata_049821 [Turnera subulata]|uniref:Uncharacterized protein n=1 Tax=Turnera subulata TaxID=218843 RepID=A0A9Q0GC46_9ROSI|nr:hypothetical protein Tsubulata_049821 [Turnera subulata]
MGKHPSDLISCLSGSPLISSAPPSPIGLQTLLKDVLDPCLPLPKNQAAPGFASITNLAFASLDNNPHLRPTMRQVSLRIAAPWPPLPKPFPIMVLEELLPRTPGITFQFGHKKQLLVENV